MNNNNSNNNLLMNVLTFSKNSQMNEEQTYILFLTTSHQHLLQIAHFAHWGVIFEEKFYFTH